MDVFVVSDGDKVTLVSPVAQPSTVTLVNQSVVFQTGSSSSSAEIVTRIAASAVSGHTCVGVDSSGRVVASGSDTVGVPPIGITLSAAAAGALATVQVSGEVSDASWSWDTTRPVFAGLGGALMQTVPSSGIISLVGYPTSPTSLVLNIDSTQIA